MNLQFNTFNAENKQENMLKVRCFEVNPFQENTYCLFNDKKEALIIDPGFYTEYERDIFLRFIEENQLELKACWLTHAHLDHIFACRFIHEEFGLKPQMHERERKVYESAEQVSLSYGIPMSALPEPNYAWNGNSGELDLLGMNFNWYFTPGHSPGSVSFYLKEIESIWSGDVLFRMSIGRTDLPGSNFEILKASIQEVLYQLPPKTKVYSGHGPETSIGYEMNNNPFVQQ